MPCNWPIRPPVMSATNTSHIIKPVNFTFWEKSCFCEHLFEKRPSHFSHEWNSLWPFLAGVWQLTISRYSQSIFRSDFLFTCNQRCPLGDFDWRVSLIQWQWPARQRTGLTKNADADNPCRWFLSCPSSRLLAALEFVISASPLFSSRLTCLKTTKLRN